MRAAARSRQRGLTLVEVLIALVLLAVVLLPVIIGFAQALASTSDSAIAAAATSIARDKIEELKGMDFAAVADQERETRHLNAGDGFFEVAVTVETVRPDDAAHSGLKRVAVTVYRAGGNDPAAVVTTYLTPFGV